MRYQLRDALEHVLEHDETPTRGFRLYIPLWGVDVHSERAGDVAALGERLLARWPDPAVEDWAEVAAVTATTHLAVGDAARTRELATQALDVARTPLATVIAGRAIMLASLLAAGDPESARASSPPRQRPPRAPTGCRRGGSSWRCGGRSRWPPSRSRRRRRWPGTLTGTPSAPTARSWPSSARWSTLTCSHSATRTRRAGSSTTSWSAAPATRWAWAWPSGRAPRSTSPPDATPRPRPGCGRPSTPWSRRCRDPARTRELAVGRRARRSLGAGARAAAQLTACAGTVPEHDIGGLLAKATLPPGPAIVAVPAPLLREALALAREVLAAEAAAPAAETVPATGAVFRCEGAVWTLAFQGVTARLPDAKGLHDLAVLLAAPGGEVRSVDLAGAAVAEPDIGPVLDAQARRSYEHRIRELQAALVEAEDAYDQRGADRARLELDHLVEQLTAATGLGGRARRAGGTAERPSGGRLADPGGAGPHRRGSPATGRASARVGADRGVV